MLKVLEIKSLCTFFLFLKKSICSLDPRKSIQKQSSYQNSLSCEIMILKCSNVYCDLLAVLIRGRVDLIRNRHIEPYRNKKE